ncbi:MAG: hypothetical protein WCO13_14670 [Bacteroidota bacterium]
MLLLGIKGVDYSNHGQYPINANSDKNAMTRNISNMTVNDYNYTKHSSIYKLGGGMIYKPIGIQIRIFLSL